MNGYDHELWKKLIEAGRKVERGTTHQMTPDQLLNISDWVDYVGAPQGVEDPMELGRIMNFDLRMAKYKLYDLTGMVMQGRWGDDLKVMGHKIAKSYVGCVDEQNVTTPQDLYDCINKEMYKE
jgi:hypothetical protein